MTVRSAYFGKRIFYVYRESFMIRIDRIRDCYGRTAEAVYRYCDSACMRYRHKHKKRTRKGE